MSKFYFSSYSLTNVIRLDVDLNPTISLIESYWDDLSNEIRFPIDQKALIRLRAMSDLETQFVCLEVLHIDNKDLVYAEWKPFNHDTIVTDINKTYYIISDELFEHLTDNDNINPTVVARILKETTSTGDFKYGIFCHKAQLVFKVNGTGSEPVSTNSSGTKL